MRWAHHARTSLLSRSIFFVCRPTIADSVNILHTIAFSTHDAWSVLLLRVTHNIHEVLRKHWTYIPTHTIYSSTTADLMLCCGSVVIPRWFYNFVCSRQVLCTYVPGIYFQNFIFKPQKETSLLLFRAWCGRVEKMKHNENWNSTNCVYCCKWMHQKYCIDACTYLWMYVRMNVCVYSSTFPCRLVLYTATGVQEEAGTRVRATLVPDARPRGPVEWLDSAVWSITGGGGSSQKAKPSWRNWGSLAMKLPYFKLARLCVCCVCVCVVQASRKLDVRGTLRAKRCVYVRVKYVGVLRCLHLIEKGLWHSLPAVRPVSSEEYWLAISIYLLVLFVFFTCVVGGARFVFFIFREKMDRASKERTSRHPPEKGRTGIIIS